MKYILILIILAFSTNFAKAEIIVSEKPTGISVKIDNLKPSIKNNRVRFEQNSKYTLEKKYSNYSVEYFELVFACKSFDDMTLQTSNIIHNNFSSNNPEIFINTNEQIRIEPAESYRGINLFKLIIDPLSYNPITNTVEYINSASIDITFSSHVEFVETNQISSFLWSLVDNPKQLPYFINQITNSKNSRKNSTLQENSWYTPDIDYIRISTTRDGIAVINIDKVLKLMPEWKNLPHSGLHLIRKGVEVPIYVTYNNTPDANINACKSIIFNGMRPSGDTTWLDNYAKYEVFYLYHDEITQGLRYTEIDEPANSNGIISQVQLNQHIEVDRYYDLGSLDLYHDPDQNFYEGWFWQKIFPIKSNIIDSKFDFEFMLNPIGNADNFAINLVYKAISDEVINSEGQLIEPKYQLKYAINTDTVSSRDFINARLDTFKFSSRSLMAGLNRVELISQLVDQDQSGIVGIDFIETSGLVFPFADSGKGHFSLSVDNNSTLFIPGFSGNKIYALDKLNNKILPIIEPTSKYTTYRVSSKLNSSEALFIFDGMDFSNNINIIKSDKAGIHVCHLADSINYQYFEPEQYSSATSHINSIEHSQNLFIAINSGIAPSQGFKELLTQIGSTKINSINSEAWSFAKYKDKIVENVSAITARTYGYSEEDQSSHFAYETNLPSGEYEIILADNNNIEEAAIEKVSKTDFRNVSEEYDAIFIYHKNFENFASWLADYRKSQRGLNIKLAEIKDIYKEFNYGKKSPWAIRNFLKYAYENWPGIGPEYLLLIGDASSDARGVNPDTKSVDFLPSYGNPVSDYWYGLTGQSEDEMFSDYIIGRIPLDNQEDAENYKNKILEYENMEVAPWHKKFFFMSGGITKVEMSNFYSLNLDYAFEIVDSEICGDTTYIRKTEETAVSDILAVSIRNTIDNGVIWVNYIGHAAATVFDLDGWEVNRLNNKGRYGFMSTLSCNTGAFAEPALVKSRNEEYLLAKDKGFIGALGSTTVGFVMPQYKLMRELYRGIVDTNLRMRRIGDLLFFGKYRLVPYGSELMTRYHYSLLGDPFTLLPISVKTDAYLLQDDISIYSGSSDIFTDEIKQISIIGILRNNGYLNRIPNKVKLVHEYNGDTTEFFNNYSFLCREKEFSFDIDIYQKPGTHKITIIADPANLYDDENRKNDTLSFDFEVFSIGLLPVDPLNYWDISSNNPVFRFINPLDNNNQYMYEFELVEINSGDTTLYKKSSAEEIVPMANEKLPYVKWSPEGLDLKDGKNIWLKARLIDINNSNIKSNWLWLALHTNQNQSENIANINMNNFEQFNMGDIHGFQDNATPLSLHLDSLKYHLIGVNGSPDILRWGLIEVGKTTYIDKNEARGINVVIFPRSGNDNDIGRYYRFDTWLDTTSSKRFVNLLRDSVSNDDYVFIASCDNSFWRIPQLYADEAYPNGGFIGSLDTMKTELKKFGSILADSLDNNKSFVMIGYRGAQPGSIIEDINLIDSAEIKGSIKYRVNSANINTQYLGPAETWYNASIDAFLPDSSMLETNIYGVRTDGREDILETLSGSFEYNLEEIDAKQYPYIYLDAKLSKSDNQNPTVNSLSAQFKPAVEFAAFSDPYLNKDSIMRGNNIILNASIINLQRSHAPESAIAKTTVKSFDKQYNNEFDLQGVKQDEIFDIYQEINTTQSAQENSININADPNKSLNELYYFNNTSQTFFKVYEDEELPEVEMLFDGRQIESNDYVARSPMIEIRLYDNSPLPIDDPELLRLMINGYYQEEDNTDYYEFSSISDGSSLKAILKVKPDSLNDDNLLRVYYQDATGNDSVMLIYARVIQNGKISTPLAVPNPFFETSEITFDYLAEENEANAKIFIYDISGRIVRKINTKVYIGENKIMWDGQNDYGSSCSAGVYLYLINIDSQYYVEPKHGKIHLIK